VKQKGNWVDKLERKWGKYAIPHLMKYMVVLYIIGFLISAVNYSLYRELLTLDFSMILQGQVWRLVTFIIAPPMSFGKSLMVIFAIFALLLYYSIGNTLEQVWGTFRFNLFYFGGLLACIISSFISYITVGSAASYLITTDYVFLSMFLAYAMLFPEQQLYLYGIIPIKIKWLGIVDAVVMAMQAFDAVKFIMIGGDGIIRGVTQLSIIVCSMANLFILFNAFKYKGVTKQQRKKSAEYKKKVNKLSKTRIHTCTVCGATSQSHPDMEFRFCSRCDGNREYCTEHLFTHEHITKIVINIDKDSDANKQEEEN